MAAKKKEPVAVVVTTEHRGVFFGYEVSRNVEGRVVTIEKARVCVHWSAETKGFVGLAVTGPLPGSRVSLGAPEMTLTGVTSITECTPEAIAAWEASPWK